MPAEMKIKPDFPPLLPPGIHPKTLEEIREMCVDAFPRSVRRKLIMEGLERFIKTLSGHGISGRIWLDGNFMTQEIDPEEADLVVEFDAAGYDGGTDLTRALLNKIADEDDKQYFKDHYYCDPYPLAVHPETDPQLHKITESSRKFWLQLFGHDQRFRPKGMATLELSK